MPIPIIDPSRAITNERLARLETMVVQINDRLTRLQDNMQKSFRWLVGILFTILLTILGATVTILLNLPK